MLSSVGPGFSGAVPTAVCAWVAAVSAAVRAESWSPSMPGPAAMDPAPEPAVRRKPSGTLVTEAC